VCAQAAIQSIAAITADAETVPATHSGDAADDPAIWVHPTDPGRSLLIGNDKLGGLDVYKIDGSLQQRLTTATSFWGNV
jgi:myo-inositol-hexaphosphate 3-phosphohydrolase